MRTRILIPLCAALAAALLLVFTGCGKNKPKTDAPSADIPENYDENATAEFESIMADFKTLTNIDDNAYVRTAKSGEALKKVLAGGETGAIRLQTADADAISIPAGDHSGATVVLNAANASVVSDAVLGEVIVEAMGEGGLTLNGSVKSLVVTGENVTATLNGGAEKIYVQGKNCTVRLAGGAYGSIVSVNVTAVIENATDQDVTVYAANGAPQTLKAGETMRFVSE